MPQVIKSPNLNKKVKMLFYLVKNLEAKNLQQFQKELLSSLYELKEALVLDIKGLG